jgi:hypothetical protein
MEDLVGAESFEPPASVTQPSSDEVKVGGIAALP